MDVEIDSIIRKHMKLFQALGFCTISLDTSHNRRRVERFLLTWSITSVLAVMAITVAIFICQNNILYIGDDFGQLNDISKFSCVAIAYEVALIEAILCRDHDRWFWNKYRQLQVKKSQQVMEKPAVRYRYFLWCFYGYLAVKTVCEISFVLGIRHRKQWLMNWIIFTPNALITALSTMHTILYIELIRAEIRDLNLRLICLRRRCKRLRGAALAAEFKQIGKLMKTYELIYEMLEHFKATCGWSMAGNFIKSYILVLANFYWTFWIVYNENELIEYLLLITVALEMGLPLVVSRKCMREAMYISYHVHRLRHPIEVFRFSVLIESFSLQIIHQKLEINARGFFKFDCKIFQQVLGSIAIYMLFFIQFLPKFKLKET